MKRTIRQARLLELFSYDRATGIFTRNFTTSSNAKAGGAAGGVMSGGGYRRIKIDGVYYRAHRLVWLYVFGCWPTHQIDHIDGNPANNALSNLRDVPQALNCQNLRKPRSDNRSSGLLGVQAHANRWRALISIGGKQRRIGSYATPEEAHAAYLNAKRQHHAGCAI